MGIDMFDETEDYYKILQVQHNAEPEVIKAAYINLSKKYHPDNNNLSMKEEKIKKLNRAYEILSNPVLREKYYNKKKNKEIILKDNPDKRKIEETIYSYIYFLSKRLYEDAYALISEFDRYRIRLGDFIKWQSLVSEIFRIDDFICEIKEYDPQIKSAKIKVEVKEYNLLMKREETDTFYKNIVFEKGSFRVHLGYSSIKGIVDKFASLVALKNNSSMINLTESTYCKKKEEFMILLQREQARYTRYGNQYSVIALTMKPKYIEKMEEITRRYLRVLDFGCKWKENMYLIVLPETDEKNAKIVALKIKKQIQTDRILSLEVVKFRVKEQLYLTLEELFYNLIR